MKAHTIRGHVTLNQWVTGSNPVRLTTDIYDLAGFIVFGEALILISRTIPGQIFLIQCSSSGLDRFDAITKASTWNSEARVKIPPNASSRGAPPTLRVRFWTYSSMVVSDRTKI